MKDCLKLSTFALVCVLLSSDVTEAGNDDLYSQLLRGNMPENQKEAIVKVVEKMPESSREILVKCALKLIKDDMSGKDKKSIIQILTNIQDANKDHFTDQTLKIITDDFSDNNRVKIIEMLSKKQISELESFAKQVLRIRYETLSQTDKFKIFDVLFKKKSDKLEKFVTEALKITSAQIQGKECVKIVEELSKIKDVELENFVNQLSKLVIVDEHLLEDEISKLLKLFGKVKTADRDAFISQTTSIISDSMGSFERVLIVKALEKIDPQERDLFLRQVRKFIVEDMDNFDIALSIESFAKVKSSDRKAVLELCLKIIREEEIPTHQQNTILASLVQADLKIRGNLVNKAKEICTDPDLLPTVINQMSITPLKELDQVIATTLKLSVDGSDQEKYRMFLAIQGFNTSEYEDVIQLTNITAITIKERALLIRALSFLQSSEREAFLSQVLEITQDIHRSEKYGLIEILTSIKKENRQFIVSQYKRLSVLDVLDVSERIMLLSSITRDYYVTLPNVEIEARIQRVLDDRRPEDNYFRFSDVIHTPSNEPLPPRRDEDFEGLDVHTGNRDELVKQSLEMLIAKQNEDNTTSEEITIAYDKFRAFLESWPNQQQKDKAVLVLNNGNGQQGFGGFERANRLLGINNLNGKTLLGRLWLFAEKYQDGKEFNEIKEAIIASLIRCIEDGGHVVCDQGKTQRLVVGVLQGRLQGVNIDQISQLRRSISDADLSGVFFTPERQEMDAAQLRAEIAQFIEENPNVSVEQLNRIVEGYITASIL